MTVSETKLANGLRIVTADLADARSLTVNVMVGVGSRYEQYEANGGVSHFLEHLLFKGTAKYPTAQAIAEAIDEVGGYNNAFTSEDLTWYFIKVPAQHGALAVDILTDMMKTPIFDPAEVDRERGVIIEEMNVYRDDPARYVYTLVPPLLFPDNPLGCEIIGTEAVINSIPVEQIVAYQKRHYAPNNLVISAAGRVDHDTFVRQVEEAMGSLEHQDLDGVVPIGAKPAEHLAANHQKDTAQAHFVVASRAYAYDHASDTASKVLSAILGRGMSSRLFDTVRERQGLAYTIYSDITNYVDTGIFNVYAGVNLDKIDQALESVLNELERIRHEPVAEAELRKAQQQLRAGLEMSLESNSAIADRIGTQLLLTGKVKTVDETIAEIEAVTIADIQRVATEMLAPESLRFAIIAPEPEAAAAKFSELVTKGAK